MRTWMNMGRQAGWAMVGLIGVAATVLVLWVALGPGAVWVLEHADGVKGLKDAELAEALDRVRGRAVAIGTGLLAAVAIFFTARTARAALDSSAAAQQTALATQQTAAATEQGLMTGRYTAAITQLGDKNSLDIRLGGIYALERIATDSERDAPVIAEVLATFVREHLEDSDARRPLSDANPQRCRLRADLRAALAVLGRRTHDNGIRPDLAELDLHQLDLPRITLTRTNLHGTDLHGTDLHGADLSGADLRRSNLNGANLRNADLRRANLLGADLRGADLRRADLRGSNLNGANTDGARGLPAEVL